MLETLMTSLYDVAYFLLTSTHYFAGLILAWIVINVVYRVVCRLRKPVIASEGTDQVVISKQNISYDRKLNDSSLKCQFPDCVRCSKNREILTRAATKLSYYSDMGVGGSETDRKNIRISLATDINESNAHLKSLQTKERDDDILARPVSSPVVLHLRGLREDELWSKDNFPDLQLLEISCDQIQKEFRSLYTRLDLVDCEGQPLWKCNNTDTGRWDIALLVDQGRETRAAELCPATMFVLSQIPNVMRDNVFGDISFSVVHPGTTISTHCGSTNMRIRCHLGLQVPAGNVCHLKVRDKTCTWRENDIICFNDAHPHSVHHTGNQLSGYRAILMVDLWHPDLSDVHREMLSFAFTTL